MPAVNLNGRIVYPYSTTGSYSSSSGATTVNDVEYRNFVTDGVRWYDAAYSSNDSAVTTAPNKSQYVTDKHAWVVTPLYYDIFPNSPATYAEPVAANENYDDHYQTSLGVANVLNYTVVRAADGSLTETGTDLTAPYTRVLHADGTGTDHAGPADGGTLWTYGLPFQSGSGYVIPATETYAGQMHTNDVPDWYPGHKAAPKPLATAAMANLGTAKAPAGCGTRAGTVSTHLQYTYRQLDSVGGDTYDETDDYYIVDGPGRICRLDDIVETYYDQKVKGTVTETKTTTSAEVLLSQKLVQPAALNVSKPSLTFTALGASAKQSFAIDEAGYDDAFAVVSSNPRVATVSAPTAQNGGTIAVTPVSGGKTTIVVTDAAQQTKSITVAVTGATLTLRDLPASARSVRVSSAAGAALDASVTLLAGCSASKVAQTCVLSAGVLPGTGTLTVESFSGASAGGTLLTKTSLTTDFVAGSQSALAISNARFDAYFKVAGVPVGSLTAGATGDPNVYFAFDPTFGAMSIAQMTTKGAYRAYAESAPGRPSRAPGTSGSALMWFASNAAIGSLSSAGKATYYKTTVGACKTAYVPYSLALGPDGDPWYTESACANNGIGTLVAGKPSNYLFPLDANKKAEYALSAASQHQIVTGHDGNLWFVAIGCGFRGAICNGPSRYALGRITPAGALTFLDLGLAVTCPSAYLAPAGDGNVWFVTCAPGAKKSTVVRVTPAGVATQFAGLGTVANDVAEGADGNLYFTVTGAIARLVTTGAELGRVDYYYPPSGVPETESIGAGPDGLLYVTNSNGYVDQIEPPSP